MRDALDTSVTWSRPPLIRATRYESMVPTARSSSTMPCHVRVSFERIHASLVAEKYGSSRKPVVRRTSSS